jgi:putative membrane protein
MTTFALIRWFVAALHLLGLGLGIAALLWISTGLARAFAGLEKGSAYYLANEAFWLKMGLRALVLIMEIWPMVTLIRWRIQLSRGETLDTSNAGRFARISALQAVLVVAMVFAATAMARGLGV